MSLAPDPDVDPQQLVPFLLGLLPDAEAERLDAASIADDDIAMQLRTAEDDLVDAYVRGVLVGETLERFESFYLASPRRRAKVSHALNFLRAVDLVTAPDGAATQHHVAEAPAETRTSDAAMPTHGVA